MNKYIKYTLGLLAVVTLSGCNDFLDTMPDNRATLDSEEKIIKMLTSAYAENSYAYTAELMSDNCDSYSTSTHINPNGDRFSDQNWAWIDETESNNESVERFWSSSYIAIASANEALVAINNLGSNSSAMKAARGEALLSRAYHHFLLASMFCWRYDNTAEKQLGLPYMDHPETELNPQYQRGNLKDFYDKIQEDLEEGLTLITDENYQVPKYHFNVKAAWAFAARFYLYTEQWEKCIEAANNCLGASPKVMLRDWQGMSYMTQTAKAICNEYISGSANCNLLMQTLYSNLGIVFGPYSSNSRYSHGAYLAGKEDITATNIWGSSTMFWNAPKTYRGTNFVKVIFWKMPYLFEYTDINAGIGYRHSVVVPLTADECLTNRAEALIMLKRYDEAAADLTLFMQNITKSTKVLTPDNITSFYADQKYCYDDDEKMVSALKKHLNPGFAIDDAKSTQESMLQCVLGFRRIETLHAGLRWFDIKRYGIEIPRRHINLSEEPEEISDWLSKEDLRRAVQVPLKVRDAGFQPNPR